MGVSVEIREIGEGAAVQQVVLHIADGTLDLALGASAIGLMSFRDKAIVIGKVHEERVPGLRVQSDLLHVVVENLLAPAAEKREGILMAAAWLSAFISQLSALSFQCATAEEEICRILETSKFGKRLIS